MTRLKRLLTITASLAILSIAGNEPDAWAGEPPTQYCNYPYESAPDALDGYLEMGTGEEEDDTIYYVDNDGCGDDLGDILGTQQCYSMCSNYHEWGGDIYDCGPSGQCSEGCLSECDSPGSTYECWDGDPEEQGTPCICAGGFPPGECAGPT